MESLLKKISNEITDSLEKALRQNDVNVIGTQSDKSFLLAILEQKDLDEPQKATLEKFCDKEKERKEDKFKEITQNSPVRDFFKKQGLPPGAINILLFSGVETLEMISLLKKESAFLKNVTEKLNDPHWATLLRDALSGEKLEQAKQDKTAEKEKNQEKQQEIMIAMKELEELQKMTMKENQDSQAKISDSLKKGIEEVNLKLSKLNMTLDLGSSNKIQDLKSQLGSHLAILGKYKKELKNQPIDLPISELLRRSGMWRGFLFTQKGEVELKGSMVMLDPKIRQDEEKLKTFVYTKNRFDMKTENFDSLEKFEKTQAWVKMGGTNWAASGNFSVGAIAWGVSISTKASGGESSEESQQKAEGSSRLTCIETRRITASKKEIIIPKNQLKISDDAFNLLLEISKTNERGLELIKELKVLSEQQELEPKESESSKQQELEPKESKSSKQQELKQKLQLQKELKENKNEKKNLLNKFFKTYGSHVIVSVTFGGFYEFQASANTVTKEKKEEVQRAVSKQLNKEFGAAVRGFGSGIIGGASGAYADKKEESKGEKNAEHSQEIYSQISTSLSVKGGHSSAPVSQWTSSLEFNESWEVIERDLAYAIPVWELLNNHEEDEFVTKPEDPMLPLIKGIQEELLKLIKNQEIQQDPKQKQNSEIQEFKESLIHKIQDFQESLISKIKMVFENKEEYLEDPIIKLLNNYKTENEKFQEHKDKTREIIQRLKILLEEFWKEETQNEKVITKEGKETEILANRYYFIHSAGERDFVFDGCNDGDSYCECWKKSKTNNDGRQLWRLVPSRHNKEGSYYLNPKHNPERVLDGSDSKGRLEKKTRETRKNKQLWQIEKSDFYSGCYYLIPGDGDGGKVIGMTIKNQGSGYLELKDKVENELKQLWIFRLDEETSPELIHEKDVLLEEIYKLERENRKIAEENVPHKEKETLKQTLVHLEKENLKDNRAL